MNVYNHQVNFETVLETLAREWDRLQIRYAAIGGFALGVLGAPRATMDLDFLVHREDLSKLHEALTAFGYKRVFCTENVSQYHHEDEAWGSVDFIHAFRNISLAMLARAKSYSAFGGKHKVRVVDPEDVIGLKVQAMTNDPGRRTQESNDIERLAGLYGPKLDWERIEDFYRLFGLEEEAMRLKERFGNAE